MTSAESRITLPSLDEAVRTAIQTERADCLRGPDSPDGRAMAALVGGNVAFQRARRGIDLDTLSARSALPADLLALLEAGQAVPSLRAVWALATALAVPFGALLAQTHGTESVFRVQRADRGRRLASAGGGFRSRALSPSGDPRAPEVYELTLAPGCFEVAAAHARDTFEHLVVVRGTLVVRAGDAEAVLGAGDALYFRADGPHSYANPTAEETVVHLVMAYA